MNSTASSVHAASPLGYDSTSTLRDSGKMTDTEFEKFVMDNEDVALRLAFSYLKDWEEARDAVQDGFVKAYRKMGSFRGDSSRRTWFYRLMVNLLKDKLRRKKVRRIVSFMPFGFAGEGDEPPPMDPADSSQGPAEETEAMAIREAFERALEALPERQGQVAALHLASGMTLKQAADTLGISEGAAKAHYFRAVRGLRKEMALWKDETK